MKLYAENIENMSAKHQAYATVYNVPYSDVYVSLRFQKVVMTQGYSVAA